MQFGAYTTAGIFRLAREIVARRARVERPQSSFWRCLQCLIVSCFLTSALWDGVPVMIGATLRQERFLTCVAQISADALRYTPNSDERLTVVILEHQKFLEMRDAFHAHKTKLAFSSLTPPTKPIPFPLHVVTVTFRQDF